MGYIYKITNKINNKIYIGQTEKTVQERFLRHCESARLRDKDFNCPFHLALNKYGPENFEVDIVEQIENSLLCEREKYWIHYYNSYEEGYNATRGGDGCQKYNYDLIYQRYCEGKTSQEIQLEFGCDKGVVRSALYSFGVTKEQLYQRSGKARQKFSDEDFLSLWNQGLRVSEIAKQLSCSDKTVSKRLDKLGITSQQRHERYYNTLRKQ